MTPTLDEINNIHKYLKIGGLQIPYNTDAWDGYPRERERLFKELKNANSILVLTGDTHNSWLNNLYDKNNNFIGVEIGTPAISSPNTIDTFKSLTAIEQENQIKQIEKLLNKNNLSSIDNMTNTHSRNLN